MLEARLRAPTTEQRDVLRGRIILLAAEGHSTRSIARTVGTMPRTVSLWRGRFARDGLAGLTDKPRPGPTPERGAESGRRILAALDTPPPAGFARWTGPLIAAEPGDVHEQQVWRFLRVQRIDLDGRKSWCESQDPENPAAAQRPIHPARSRDQTSIGRSVSLWQRVGRPRPEPPLRASVVFHPRVLIETAPTPAKPSSYGRRR